MEDKNPPPPSTTCYRCMAVEAFPLMPNVLAPLRAGCATCGQQPSTMSTPTPCRVCQAILPSTPLDLEGLQESRRECSCCEQLYPWDFFNQPNSRYPTNRCKACEDSSEARKFWHRQPLKAPPPSASAIRASVLATTMGPAPKRIRRRKHRPRKC